MAEPQRKSSRCQMKHVFSGTVVHSTKENMMEICKKRLIGVDSKGKIAFIDSTTKLEDLAKKFGFQKEDVISLQPGRQFLMPGFVDTHIHAPQYVFTGTGYDLPLLDWLEKYTFPSESRFRNVEFAQVAYCKVVKRLLKNGTTTASYFATIHYEASEILCDIVAELGQRCYIGKVCMDRNSPDYYIEETEQSIKDTERFVKHVLELKNPLITPVVTPRFVLSCTSRLMKKLGHIAKKYDVPIQSHLNESKNEIALVEKDYPGYSYTAVYDKHNLLNNKTYMAHCCHGSDEELNLLSERCSAVAHCPTSNFKRFEKRHNIPKGEWGTEGFFYHFEDSELGILHKVPPSIRSGIADVRYMLDKNVKVGLGTDVSGGESSSMLVAMRDCIKASNVLSHNKSDGYTPLTFKEAFFLATLGGCQVLGLDEKIGNFEVGKDFDALLIDAETKDSPFDCFKADDLRDVVQKFLMLGDDRNIRKVFVAGKLVAGVDVPM